MAKWIVYAALQDLGRGTVPVLASGQFQLPLWGLRPSWGQSFSQIALFACLRSCSSMDWCPWTSLGRVGVLSVTDVEAMTSHVWRRLTGVGPRCPLSITLPLSHIPFVFLCYALPSSFVSFPFVTHRALFLPADISTLLRRLQSGGWINGTASIHRVSSEMEEAFVPRVLQICLFTVYVRVCLTTPSVA